MSVLSKLKRKKKDATTERDERCVPVARELLKFIGEFDGPLGVVTPQEMQKGYDEMVKGILAILLANDVLISELNYIFQMVEQRVSHAKEWTNASMNQNISNALKQYWEKEQDEVSFTDVEKKFAE